MSTIPCSKTALGSGPLYFKPTVFFAVKLTKTAPIPVDGNTRPKPPSRPTKLKELSYNIQEQLFEYFEQNFAFNLENLLEEKNLALYWWGEKRSGSNLKKFFEVFTTLPVQLVGIQIGQFIRQNFEPSPDFILSYGQHFDKGYWLIPEEETENWMKGYDIRGIKIPALKTGSFFANSRQRRQQFRGWEVFERTPTKSLA